MFISDTDGWDARAEALAAALADDGALVLGVDLPAYLKQMVSINDKCSLPAAHFEEMSDWMQRNQKLKKFTYPVLVGDGAGAAFAYAIDAQAPKGTFAALVTLGFDCFVPPAEADLPGRCRQGHRGRRQTARSASSRCARCRTRGCRCRSRRGPLDARSGLRSR